MVLSSAPAQVRAWLSTLKPGTLRLYLAQAIAAVSSLLTLIILNATLGTGPLGKLLVAVTIFFALRTLLTLQSWPALLKRAIELEQDENLPALASLFKSYWLLDIMSGALSAAVGFLLLPWFAEWLEWEPALLIGAGWFIWVLLISWLNVPLAVIRMYSAQNALALSFIIAPCLQLLAAITLWFAGETEPEIYYPWWAASYGIEAVILFALGYRILARAGVKRWMTAPVQFRRQGLTTAWWTNIAKSLNVVVLQVDIILVSAIINMEAVTIYRFLKQVGILITRLVDPLFQSSFADLMRIGTAPGPESAHEFRRATSTFAFISVPLCFLATISSPLWLSIIFGPEQMFLWSTVAIFMVAISVNSTFVAIHPLAIGLGFARVTTFIQACSYTLFLTGMVFLGGLYGLIGVVSSYLAGMLLMTGWKLYLVLPRLRVQ
ncbi:MAG: oligosaccharide flippase family protein [Gammaproteobacteria bacterium]|nr:oligosaccharide flippase family protein [Gammaproteobacteria bacterium]